MEILGGIIDFITAVFSGNWRKAWESIVNVFGSVWNVITDIAQGAINAVISCVNGLIRAYNRTIGAAGDVLLGWLGVDIKIKEIPKLGGYRYGQGGNMSARYYKTGTEWIPYDNFPAYLHKGEAVLTASQNAVMQRLGGVQNVINALQAGTMTPQLAIAGAQAPENMSTGHDTYAVRILLLLQQILQALQGNNTQFPGDVIMKIGAETVGRVAIEYMLQYVKTHGTFPVPLPV